MGYGASGRAPVLPDLLRPGLKFVFCGTAAGTISAARGAYYAHPQNRFWPALHAAGLTSRLLGPEEFGQLPQWGLGLTEIAKHVSGMDRELPAGALGREARAELNLHHLLGVEFLRQADRVRRDRRKARSLAGALAGVPQNWTAGLCRGALL